MVLLAVTSAAAAALEVAAITILVLLGKLTADGKWIYRGNIGWLHHDVALRVGQLVIVGLVVVAVRLVLQVWASWLEASVSSEYMAEQRNRLFESFIRSSWDAKSSTRVADLQTLLTSYVDITVTMLTSLASGVSSLGTVAVMLGSALFLNPLFALAIGVVGTLLFFMLRPLSMYAKRRNHDAAHNNMRYSRDIIESVLMAREIEVFHVGDEVEKKVRSTVDDTRRSTGQAILAQSLLAPLYQNAMLLIAFAALATVALGGFSRVEVLGIIVLILLRTASYTQGLQSVYHHVVGKAVYLDEIAAAEAKHLAGVRRDGSKKLGDMKSLAFDRVEFAYLPDVPVLHELSFSVRSGESIGVVGPSGSGKSTLTKLVLGLHAPKGGSILVNGLPLTDITTESWHRRIAFVPQEPMLLADSVEANIRFFRPELTFAQVEAAARAAHIHDTILEMPEGYGTNLGDRGSNLSGGQRQRICIARALVGKPDLLILDEPTSALDAISEAAIRQTLSELHSQVTVIIIAHRLSLLDHCDRVLVMQNGRLEAFDTPEKLVATNAFYRKSRELLLAEVQSANG